MGQNVNRAQHELLSGLGVTTQPEIKPVVRNQSSLPEGVTMLLSHTFETSGNSLALFQVEKAGDISFRVTTRFEDGTLVRNDYDKWDLARKLMGRKPKEETNG